MGSKSEGDTRHRKVKEILRMMIKEDSQDASSAAGLENSPEWRKRKVTSRRDKSQKKKKKDKVYMFDIFEQTQIVPPAKNVWD